MIEIIERGTNKQITRCKYCGCKFSYEYDDTELKYHDQQIPKTIRRIIHCPQCTKTLCLENKKIMEVTNG